jgi:hypothetical protein
MEPNVWCILKCKFTHLHNKSSFKNMGLADRYFFRFKNKEALEAHRKSDVYNLIQKKGAELQILAAAPDIKLLQHVGGFGLR